MVGDCVEAIASTDGRARPGGRLGLGLVLLAAILSGEAQAAGQITTPIISALAWRSGARDGDCLAALRGKPLDVTMGFISHPSFAEMVRYSGGGFFQRMGRKSPLWAVSAALVPDDRKQQFAQCAAGSFDTYWRQIGANLARAGAQGIVVRLGWEANTGSSSHAWGVDSAAQIPAYVQCFRHVAGILKAASPNLLIEWTSSKKGKQSFNVMDMYPGDDVVDVIGAHYYDSGPEKNTQALWDQYLYATYNGGPWGIGAWLNMAKAHGKKLAVSEWAVWAIPLNKQPDDPVYMQNMYQFFKTNAADIAYETYFNSKSIHNLCAGTRFPASAAQYRASWGSGG